MVESHIQLPADSTGKKTRTRVQTVAGQGVHETIVAPAALPTYYVWTGSMGTTANRHMLSLFVQSGSNLTMRLRKLFIHNLQAVAVTGVAIGFDLMRITSLTQGAGSLHTLATMDTSDAVIGSNQVLAVSVGSLGESTRLMGWVTNTDEVGVTNAFPTSIIQAMANWIPEGSEVKEPVFRNAQGFTVKQIGGSTVGTFGFLAVLNVEVNS